MLTSDTLVNLMSGLGTGRDKSTGAAFAMTVIDKQQLDAAYRCDWIARKIVDIPAFDETREWRDWQAERTQIELLEQEESRLGVQPKVAKARKMARLYGGSALYFGSAGDPSQPLMVDSVGKGGLLYLHVFTRHEMIAGELDQDPLSPLFGEPRKYSLAGTSAMVDIHPSRVVRFVGADVPDRALNYDGWGDSVLQAVNDAVMQAGTAAATIAALLQEAKVDVIKVPGFMESLGAAEYRARIIERYSLANLGKSITNSLLIDAEEEWDHKQISFAQLPEVLNTYLQIASGAADIPATRLLGQTPGGLQSTGQSDIRNYYDRISAGQNLDLRPSLSRFDEVLIRSALGGRPREVHYTWAPLWQMTEVEKSEVALKKAQATKVYADAGLMPDAALGKAVQNQLLEDGTYPGLDAALDEFGTEPDDGEPEAEAVRRQAELAKQIATDAAPRTLYVSRKLINSAEFLRWAEAQGFTKTLEADLHVTIAFSRAQLDWMKVGTGWGGGKDGRLTIEPGGARLVERLGEEGAVVLLFNSSELAWRHMAIREAGASWDYQEYQPHITITYDPGDVDLTTIEPYRGALEFGPEIFEELDPASGGTRTGDGPFARDAFDPSQPRDPQGKWTTGGSAQVAAGLLAGPKDRMAAASIGLVENAEAIERAVGIDVAGFDRVLDSAGLRHALTRHGEDGIHEWNGVAQRPITRSDFGLIPRIVAEGRIVSAKPRKQKPTVTYEAEIGAERFTYVEEIRRSARQVATKTMWKIGK
jgi:phage-related protein (TIGR01555 family)